MDGYKTYYRIWLENKIVAHEHLEKPAIYSLLGDVEGKNVLCLGCGIGEECQYIKQKGAKKVVGIDSSRNMISAAKKTFQGIEFKVMDIRNLDFPQNSFDVVFASLVLHYVKDWKSVFKKVHKILKEDGIFIFSTHNPVYWSGIHKEDENEKARLVGYIESKNSDKVVVYGDYFRRRKIEDYWYYGKFKVSFYHTPFSYMIKTIIDSNFKILDCIEPEIQDSAKDINKKFWKKAKRLPLFIVFKLQKI